MDFIEAAGRSEKSGFQKFLSAAEGEEVSIEGAVHSVRNMGEIGFVVLRRREGLIQAVWEKGKTKLPLSSVHQGDVLSVSGMVRNEERAPFGRELCVEQAAGERISGFPIQPGLYGDTHAQDWSKKCGGRRKYV